MRDAVFVMSRRDVVNVRRARRAPGLSFPFPPLDRSDAGAIEMMRRRIDRSNPDSLWVRAGWFEMGGGRSPHRATRFVLAAMVPMAVFAAWSAMDGASFPRLTTPYAVPTAEWARVTSGSIDGDVARAAAR